MAEELVIMSTREIDRLGVIQQVLARRVSRVKADELLGLSAKQVARLCAAYERQGAAGLVSRRRGRPSNNKVAQATETEVLALVRKRYDDFGPTLAPGEAARASRHRARQGDDPPDACSQRHLAAPGRARGQAAPAAVPALVPGRAGPD